MNKIGDIVGGKVVLSADTLLIPCFKKIWESTEDKAYAHNQIAYIIFKHYYDSPYASIYMEDRERILRKELFAEDWEPSDLVKEAEEMYLEFTDTLNLKLLRAFRRKLEVISKYLDEPMEYMDMKLVKEILASAGMIDKTVKAIDSLEKQVRKEELESSSVRGGSEIGHFEIPKKR